MLPIASDEERRRITELGDSIRLQAVKDDNRERHPTIEAPDKCRIEGGIKLTYNETCVSTLVSPQFKKNARINFTATLRSIKRKKRPGCRIYTIPGNNRYHIEYSCNSGHSIYIDTRMGQYVNLFVECDEGTDVLPFILYIDPRCVPQE